jgi:hypothetical protein
VVVLNIDGQEEKLKGAMTEEHTLDERSRTPETGNGIRYRFRKNLRLTAGNHKVFVAVHLDDVVVEVHLTRVRLLITGSCCKPGNVSGSMMVWVRRGGNYGDKTVTK